MLGACRREPVEKPAHTPELSAPAPSASLVPSPLDWATTGYTNEMQAEKLAKEREELGIQAVGPDTTEDSGRADLEQLKALRRGFTRANKDLAAEKDKSVAIDGSTVAVIPSRAQGGPQTEGPKKK